MTISDEIMSIANQLANQGKQPTVALIKSKLRQQVPLPLIIKALKSWQHDPSFITISPPDAQLATQEPSTKALDITDAIEQALIPIKLELLELKKLLQQLINK